MNNMKITLPQLAEAVARTIDVPQAEVEKFVIDLAEEISQRLAQGEHVHVPGIGVFACGGADGNDVLWQPDSALEQEVNSPFAFFEPVELAAGVTEETLAGGLDENQAAEPEAMQPESVQPEEAEEEPEPAEEVPAEEEQAEVAEESVEEPEAEAEPAAVAEPEDVAEPEPTAEYDELPDTDEVSGATKGHFGWLELLLGLALGLIIGFIAAIYSPNPQLTPLRSALSGDYEQETEDVDTAVVVEASETTVVVHADTATVSVKANKVVVEEPSPAPVRQPAEEKTDVVTSTRYLTTMARQYYGDYHFWVYIYLHNKDIIADPDRIPSGTRVRIPDASVYGIDASSAQSVAKAQSLIESLKSGK